MKIKGKAMTRTSSLSRKLLWTWISLLFLLLGSGAGAAQNPADPLKSGFEDPPNAARPRVWWMWMNGNVTKEGIKLDLEWMHRVGLGGFENIEIGAGTPQLVKHRLVYMTPEWKDAVRYTTTLADRLGLEVTISSAPGYLTGGPWVPPSEAMKKYVWSETPVVGGKPFEGLLAKPPSNPGAFQTFAVKDPSAAVLGVNLKIPDFYFDSAVIAYRVPSTDVPAQDVQPKVTSSGSGLDPARLADGDLSKTTSLPIAPLGETSWIQYEFASPQTIRALRIAFGGDTPNDIFSAPSGASDVLSAASSESGRALEASDDGQNFRTVAVIPWGGFPQRTISFPSKTAKFFRVTFKTLPPGPDHILIFDQSTVEFAEPKPGANYDIAELVLHPGGRVNRFEEKAGFGVHLGRPRDLYQYEKPEVASGDVVPKVDVIDLTSKMQPDGRLSWTPPPGNWVVLRFGYSLLGITNFVAPAEAIGLEVDKLNHSFVKHYMDQYLDNYKSAVGADWMGTRGLKYAGTDSWEEGSQNWTDNMIAEFTKRRGYDPRPWMPVLTGRVVESAQASDRFLWDFRKTIADLIADEHYGQVAASLKERGMGFYSESHEVGRALVADGMEMKKFTDIPMSAMWTQRSGVNKEQYDFNADVRESASVAHVYGQNIAAAESMTAGAALFAWSPATLKPTADKELAEGINRFVIHCSVHQPLLDKAPGLTLGPFGQTFTRNETWAEEAGPWVEYLARSSYMLQQGRFVAEVIYFYGEDSNLTAIFTDKGPDVPEGYGYDYVNADALIHELSVKGGRITTKSGMSYRVLALDPYSEHMSLPVLRKIRDLVEQGAVIAGPKPTDTPSLADDDNEFRTIVESLWGSGKGKHEVGKGIVFAEQTASDALAALGVVPDFEYSKPRTDTHIEFVHRKLAEGDIYYVDNRSDRDESSDATFRVTGKTAELWHAESGQSEPGSYRIQDGRTTVPLRLEPWGTIFVVFRKPAKAESVTLPKVEETQLATLDGPWQVSFQKDRGAPPSITIEKLISWSESTNDGVKYFSGSGTYTKTLNAPADWFKPGAGLWIDLGDVKDLADVTVNGEKLGIVWHAPYRVDATGALKPGANQVTIKVTNTWVNRLIGDTQPNATTKYTFTVYHAYKADSPLLPSGLLGPVTLSRVSAR
jgi:hypothetical protein